MTDLPPDAIALKEGGNVAFRKQNHGLATANYKAALDLAPDNAILYSNLAASLSGEGRLNDALAASVKSIEARAARKFTSFLLLTPLVSSIRSGISPENAVELADDSATKEAAKKALAALRRRTKSWASAKDIYLLPGPINPYDPKLHPDPAIRAAQLFRQGKVTFEPFSEGARVYDTFARFAELNQIMATPPYQSGLISEVARAFMVSSRGFHQPTMEGSGDPLAVLQQQLTIEEKLTQAIGPKVAPRDVIDGYDQYRKLKGWSQDEVNAALDLSIGSSAGNAAMAMAILYKYGEAVDAYQRALDLINLASAKWETVPKANLSPWLSPPIVRGVQCGLMDAFGSYVLNHATWETMKYLETSVELADKVISDLNKEFASGTGVYPSLPEYAAFHLQQMAIVHRTRGLAHTKWAMMVSTGAATDGPLDNTNTSPLWYSPNCTRIAAIGYVQAAAWSAEDDPEVHNYLFRAIINMAHSGHVAISDIKALHEIALKSREKAKLLYEEQKTSMPIDPVKRIARYIRKLDALVASGQAKPESRLRPFPDPNMSKDTHIDQFVPAIFAENEDEADWRTPDGKFVERNPIFKEHAGAVMTGWVKASDVRARKVSPKPRRTFGRDDWPPKSFVNVYQLARKEYERRCAWAKENIEDGA